MKKRRLRSWFVPVFEDGITEVTKNKSFPLYLLAFDNFDDAYAYGASVRLSPMTNEQGEVILNDKGHAVLPGLGKINIVEISGKDIDWKRVKVVSPTFHLRGLKEQRDVIEFQYLYPFVNNSIVSIKEESEEYYQRTNIVGSV